MEEQYYEPLVGFEDTYEICTEYPHHIRRIGSTEDISDRSKNTKGYIQVKLNGHKYYLHRLIAEQFIENDDPEHKTQVDHINHDRTDNRISNLRWCTPSTNQHNKTGACNGVQYTYISYEDEPDDLLVVTDYGKHIFEDYYYSPSLNTFYFDTGVNFKQLHTNHIKKAGTAYVYTYNTEGKRVTIYFTRFKKLYDLQ